MKTIEDRHDIQTLVHNFYGKIREDEMLGPIFNHHISEEQWPAHLSKLTDFWESNLFGVSKFRGSPTQKHSQVDKHMKHTMSQKHFGRWIQLWFETIDELFEGDRAERAKMLSRKMATGQFMAVWQQRPDTQKSPDSESD